MKHLTLLVQFVLLVVFLAVPVEATLASARHAQALLGPETWSCVLEIQNEGPGRYPSVVYATVFEFDRALYFYTDTDGTQSLSHFIGQVERDRAALGPLLQEIEVGFSTFKALANETPALHPENALLANGCFVTSLYEVRRLVADGTIVTEAGLFVVYYDVPKRGLVGHTGLLYTTANGRFFWDPNQPEVRRRVAAKAEATNQEVAVAVGDARFGGPISHARYIPVPPLELGKELHAQMLGPSSRRLASEDKRAIGVKRGSGTRAGRG